MERSGEYALGAGPEDRAGPSDSDAAKPLVRRRWPRISERAGGAPRVPERRADPRAELEARVVAGSRLIDGV